MTFEEGDSDLYCFVARDCSSSLERKKLRERRDDVLSLSLARTMSDAPPPAALPPRQPPRPCPAAASPASSKSSATSRHGGGTSSATSTRQVRTECGAESLSEERERDELFFWRFSAGISGLLRPFDRNWSPSATSY